MKKDSKRVTFRFFKRHKEMLEKLSEEDKRSMTSHMEEAIEDQYIKVFGKKKYKELIESEEN